MYIKLYYSEDHKPIGAAELYAEIATKYHDDICCQFLDNFDASTICNSLLYPDDYENDDLTEDAFLLYQDTFIENIINDIYESTTIYIDDNDIVDEHDVAR
jgi:hypothetical protein